MWMIVIGPQIVFDIKKLINIIFKSIKIINFKKYTGTYLHNMCIKEFTIL
jgi:hypothetical protein